MSLPRAKQQWKWRAEWFSNDGHFKTQMTGHWEDPERNLTAAEAHDLIYDHVVKEANTGRVWVSGVVHGAGWKA